MMDALEDFLVEIEADPGFSATADVILRIRRSMEGGAALLVPERAQDVMWDELYRLGSECCSRKSGHFERVHTFQQLWHRELQAEHVWQEQKQTVEVAAMTVTRQRARSGANGESGES
jgi:hypothetical protein